MAPRANAAIRCTLARLAEVDALRAEGIARIGELSAKELLIAGTALYAGEGAKRDGSVRFANTDPRMVLFFVTWLRRCFTVAEERLRVRLYLHEGLDLEGARPVLVRAHGYSAVDSSSSRTGPWPTRRSARTSTPGVVPQ